MSPTDALTEARQAARRGAVEVALPALRQLAVRGDDAACAWLAELLGFRAAWEECIPNDGRLIANPGAVYAGNVFDDMVRLLGRAGHETGQWAAIARIAVEARRQIDRTISRPHLRTRYFRILDHLRAYAHRRGTPPHELIAIFQPPAWSVLLRRAVAPESPRTREVAYRDAVENVFRYRPDLRDDPDALAMHHFALAQTFDQDDVALRLYDAHGEVLSFDNAVHVARVRARRGEHGRAWEILRAKVSRWWPVDAAQVAPVVLLTDEHLRLLMSRERCELVLASARGPEAQDSAPGSADANCPP
jgi:hypothetical protein